MSASTLGNRVARGLGINTHEKYRGNLNLSSYAVELIPEYIDDFKNLTCLKPPDGIIYLLVVEGDIVEMGALRKLIDEI